MGSGFTGFRCPVSGLRKNALPTQVCVHGDERDTEKTIDFNRLPAQVENVQCGNPYY